MKKRFIAAIATAAFIPALAGLAHIGNQANAEYLADCNAGNAETCSKVFDGSDVKKAMITNKAYLAKVKADDAKPSLSYGKNAKKPSIATLDYAKKQKAEQAAQIAKIEAANAELKAGGWFELSRGIYGRWCNETCSKASVIGNASYWLLEVWAKDRAAGDIYARVNITEGGTVVGWTNDTAYLSQGQKGVMTFSKYLPGYGSSYGATITEFNARG